MVKQDTALLQNWLRTVVMAPGYLDQKIGFANHRYHVNEHDVVTDNDIASVHTRLNVYSSGYLMRLLDCMYTDYAISRKFMGDELFDSFAKAYLMYHPSTSYTLYDLGEKFPDFLDQTKPQLPEGEDSSAFDIPAALARVERARQVAMRTKGTEDDEVDNDVADVYQLFATTINIRIPECLQLLELELPMKQFFEAILRDEEYELPSPQRTFMAISRKNYRMMLDEITETQYLLLQECRHHTNLYDAISALSSSQNIPSADLLADAFLWLPYFRKCGFVQIVD